MKNEKSVKEINERISDGSVKVINASEMTKIVSDIGPEEAVHEVDVVTTGTFGAMCSSGVWLNFGHSEPPIKTLKVWLNDVEAYAGVAAVDAYIGATQISETRGMEYGGGHVIEDFIRGKSVNLRAEAYGTDCYPLKEISTEVKLEDLNQAIMSNPRNCYERYVVATNSTNRTLYTYMGKLLPNFGNATYSGAGKLSPITNDPEYRTIGVGTRILLGGGTGYITGCGTQASPGTGFGTLMIQGDLKEMSSEFIRGGTMSRYGTTLFVGVSVPIPILNADVAKATGIGDADIETTILDYGVASRNRPGLRKVNYAELVSGSVEINGNPVKTSSVSSYTVAERIAELLKKKIQAGQFFLGESVELLSLQGSAAPMVQKQPSELVEKQVVLIPENYYVHKDDLRCIHCGLCVSYCPAGVYRQEESGIVTSDPSLCTECDLCDEVCAVDAISLRKEDEATESVRS
ncbi:MAG: homocysteine biosynthesis protein [Candidatus Thorarchaeota archaeon]